MPYTVPQSLQRGFNVLNGAKDLTHRLESSINYKEGCGVDLMLCLVPQRSSDAVVWSLELLDVDCMCLRIHYAIPGLLWSGNSRAMCIYFKITR